MVKRSICDPDRDGRSSILIDRVLVPLVGAPLPHVGSVPQGEALHVAWVLGPVQSPEDTRQCRPDLKLKRGETRFLPVEIAPAPGMQGTVMAAVVVGVEADSSAATGVEYFTTAKGTR